MYVVITYRLSDSVINKKSVELNTIEFVEMG